MEEKSLDHNEGKPDPTIILSDMAGAFSLVPDVGTFGLKKYNRDNWALSIGKPEEHEFLRQNDVSIIRHMLAILSGEELDDETKLPHHAHIAFRTLIALEYRSRNDRQILHDNSSSSNNGNNHCGGGRLSSNSKDRVLFKDY